MDLLFIEGAVFYHSIVLVWEWEGLSNTIREEPDKTHYCSYRWHKHIIWCVSMGSKSPKAKEMRTKSCQGTYRDEGLNLSQWGKEGVVTFSQKLYSPSILFSIKLWNSYLILLSLPRISVCFFVSRIMQHACNRFAPNLVKPNVHLCQRWTFAADWIKDGVLGFDYITSINFKIFFFFRF